MKKFSILLVMFLVLGFALVACGGETPVDTAAIDAANEAAAAAEALAASAQATAEAAASALADAQAAGGQDDSAVADLQAQLEAAQAAHHILHRLNPDKVQHFEYSTTKGLPKI